MSDEVPDPETGALESLLFPLSRETFLSDYWTKQCCVVSARDSGAYRALYSPEGAEPLLGLIAFGPTDSWRVVRSEEGRTVAFPPPESAPAGIHYFYDAFSQGYTLTVDTVHRRWGSIATFCSRLLSRPPGKCAQHHAGRHAGRHKVGRVLFICTYDLI